MKKGLSLFLVLLICLGVLAGCSEQPANSNGSGSTQTDATQTGDYAKIKEKGKLVIGITLYEPMNYKENGVLTGFDTEFAQAVAKELGVEAEFKVIDWDNKEFELDAGTVDAIWNGMTLTDEVKKAMSCTDAYVKNAQVVVVKEANKSKYPDQESLKGATFAAENGSAGANAIQEMFGAENLTAVTAQSDALLEVQSGAADTCVIDITMAKAMTGEGTGYSDLTVAMELTSEEYGIGFRTGSDLTEKVNTIMAQMKENGELQKLADKYELTLAE